MVPFPLSLYHLHLPLPQCTSFLLVPKNSKQTNPKTRSAFCHFLVLLCSSVKFAGTKGNRTESGVWTLKGWDSKVCYNSSHPKLLMSIVSPNMLRHLWFRYLSSIFFIFSIMLNRNSLHIYIYKYKFFL